MLGVRHLIKCLHATWLHVRLFRAIQQSSQYFSLGRKTWLGQTSPSHGFFRLMAGVSGTLIYDWDAERVFEKDLEKFIPEFDDTKALLDVTKTCEEVRRTERRKESIAWSMYCRKEFGGSSRGWEPVVETPNTVIWKRPFKGRDDLFEYRMYGTFSDISAGAWFHVNADDVFRTIWDKTVADLKEIDHDTTTNTRVLYWRSKIPYLKDRDYVLKKNCVLDEHKRKAVVYLHDSAHPLTPETDKAVRVVRYKSVIVVSPVKSFEENGMEFSMYVVDDQGANLPKLFVDAVAAEGFLNYVQKMHDEAAAFQRKKSPQDFSAQGIVEYFGLHQPGEHEARRKRQHERHHPHGHHHQPHHHHDHHHKNHPKDKVLFSESLENAKRLQEQWEKCDAEGNVWMFVADSEKRCKDDDFVCVHDRGKPNDE